MQVSIDQNKAFPLAVLELEDGEIAKIQRGSMVYHSPGIKLKVRANGCGLFSTLSKGS